jgi:hypothetical protein
MRWSASGDRICIVYADGAVIVGSADGVRLWGKELNMPLTHVQWSPDGRLILFGTEEGEVHLYDSSGNAAAKLQLQCNEGLPGAPKLAAIEWCAGRGLVPGHSCAAGCQGWGLSPPLPTLPTSTTRCPQVRRAGGLLRAGLPDAGRLLQERAGAADARRGGRQPRVH